MYYTERSDDIEEEELYEDPSEREDKKVEYVLDATEPKL